MPKLQVHRGKRGDGTWEVWLSDDPFMSITHLGRIESKFVYWLLKMADDPRSSNARVR